MPDFIDKNMTVARILEIVPEASDLLLEFGLMCGGCMMNEEETLLAGATGHGMTEEEVEEIVAEINKYISEEKA